MKCKSMEKQLLLAQSGELSWFRQSRLMRHLRECANCRQFENELHRVTDAWRTWQAVPNVNSRVLERIRSAAEKQTARNDWIHIRPSREPLSTTFRPAIIYTALGILLLTGFWLAIRPALHSHQIVQTQSIPAISTDWDLAKIDTQIEDLNNRLNVAMTDEDLLSAENKDVDSIARELLALEG